MCLRAAVALLHALCVTGNYSEKGALSGPILPEPRFTSHLKFLDLIHLVIAIRPACTLGWIICSKLSGILPDSGAACDYGCCVQ